MKFFKNIFKTTSEGELKKIQPIVDKIINYEDKYSKLTDFELRHKTIEFKNRLKNGETLDDILPEAFATVREAAWRVLGMKHFKVQLMGGIILHQGRISEMATGSGKTLVATLPAYLNALTGEGVYVVTVNDYLAKRDSVWMGKIYKYLGLSVGLILHDMNSDERREAYNCDITYGTNNEFGFDYLRDNMIKEYNDKVQRKLNYAIVDEVDSILIDEARTPLIISGAGSTSNEGYIKANNFVKGLKKLVIVEDDEMDPDELDKLMKNADYIVEEKKKTSTLTDKGVTKAEAYYQIKNLSDPDNMEINHYITRSLKAYGIFKRDVDYVVNDGKIIIVDESTGRLMHGRRYNEGVHQAIEAKEGVDVQHESRTLASITFQNLFRKFNKLSGMTGTALTEEEEFKTIYCLDVVKIPTNKPIQRIDKEDSIYINRKMKLQGIIKRVKDCYEKGQPILVGTVSVEKSEELSKLLKKERIPHNILNAKYHEQEAKIIAQAGKFGAVTIATNMAGRGTDIILGGNPEYLALDELRKEGYDEELINEATGHSETDNQDIINIRKLFIEKENKFKEQLQPEADKVKAAGGLYVLGTERHESRRIDDQLRGRSGRQGDVGVSEFMISLEDDLFRLFVSKETVDKLVNSMITISKTIGCDEDDAFELKSVTKQIEKAQKNIQGKHYLIRKNLLEYDEVVSTQRDLIYEERNKILINDIEYKELFEKILEEVAEKIVNNSICDKKHIYKEETHYLKENFDKINFDFDISKYTENIKYEDILEDCKNQIKEIYDNVYNYFKKEKFDDYSKRLLLFLIDNNWQEHLIAIDELKQGVGLRAYAQTDPLAAFKFECFELFEGMMEFIKEEVFITMMNAHKKIEANNITIKINL